MKQTWFFDLDGTLADTQGDLRLAWKAALADLGLVCPDFDEKFVAGPNINEMVKILFPERFAAGADEEFIRAFRAGFAQHYDHCGFPATREYPGVLDAVRQLKTAGAAVYVATNKRHKAARLMMEHFGWDRVFDGLYAADMFDGQPIRKGELLRRAMAELGASAADCVMVGDTSGDVVAAAESGMSSVAVTWGYGPEAELAAADRICSLADISVRGFAIIG